MIIVVKNGAQQAEVEALSRELTQAYGVTVNTWQGVQSTVLGLLGDTAAIDIDAIKA
ncbi:MAG: 3-deoxy-7-phosphoheptulonate synthase, partial [Clostridiales bacterium]|nr:3-deoxy-7-phosphoheptulonate synthase [Clostridiales bacterium]